MKTWILAHYKQLGVLALSVAAGYVAHRYPQHIDLVLLVSAALAGVGIHLQPITYGSIKPPPPTLPGAVLALALLTATGLVFVPSCNVAKDATVAAHVMECINANIDLPPEQIIIKCGLENAPAVISLIEGQKGLHTRAKPCTVITVDAGAPKGPGL